MKVGVITFHNAMNYGATLQTYALQKALTKLGTEAAVINYHTEPIDVLYLPARADTLGKKLMFAFSPDFRRKIREQKYKYQRYHAFLNKYIKIEGNYTQYSELEKTPPLYDAYITGSDQVWNVEHTGGFDGAYLLDFVKKGRRISYAASIGSDYIPFQYKSQFEKSLEKFDAISVREQEGVKAVSQVCSKKAEIVLDPTLLLQREDYNEILVEKKRPYKYILVYMMETNKSMISLVNSISSTMGLPIIQRRQVSFFNNEADSFYTDTPGEFIGEILNAEYVITNSFHGTVFSIMYEKPFISMLHSSTGSRVTDLLESLGLDEHIIRTASDFKTMSQFEIKDKAALRERIDKLAGKSMDFLKKSLKL